MSTRRDNPILARPDSGGEHVAPSRLAHELANLLDGSLRNIGLAIRTLRADSPSATSIEPQPVDPRVLHRLDTASEGLKQMASLLRAWLGDATAHAASSDAGGEARPTITLGEVMQRCAALLAPAAVAAGVRLDMTAEPDAAAVAIDASNDDAPAAAWPHIIDNLVRNGIAAIRDARMSHPGEPPTVSARLRAQHDQLTLTVIDNGPGFAPTLFDNAGQFVFGRSTRPNGHGLGLALCRDLAARMGGTLELSNRPRRGAQAVVRVPLT